MFLVDKSGKPVERIPGTPWLSTEVIIFLL
jgi:hypothetical protein